MEQRDQAEGRSLMFLSPAAARTVLRLLLDCLGSEMFFVCGKKFHPKKPTGA